MKRSGGILGFTSALIVSALILTISGCTSENNKAESTLPVSSDNTSYVSDNTSTSDVSDNTESDIAYSSETVSELSEESMSLVPTEWQDDGIFSDHYERAYELLSSMTSEQKVGQILLAGCPETEGAADASKYHLGGYVLFGRDLNGKTKEEIVKNLASYNQSADIPMVIAVDEEGGTVSRLSGNYELISHEFLSPRELFESGGIDLIESDTVEKSHILSSLGINVNLAPVCDICTYSGDFMYDRSIGQSPQITADFVSVFVNASQRNMVSATLKHFPGYGSNLDTHTGIAIDKRTYETFVQNDFIPFIAGIKAGANFVLVNHNIVKCMDERNPSSISPEVHRVLRDELGFTGVVITDDLSMDGVGAYMEEEYSKYVAAVIAGNDMLIVREYKVAYDDISDALEKNILDEKLLDHAVFRVLAWKLSKGLIR